MDDSEEFFLCKIKPTKKWLQQRRNTTIIFMFQSILISLEYPIFLLTQWAYIKELVKPDSPKLVYSLSTSAYFVTSFFSTVLIKRLVTKCHNVKLVFMIINTIAIFGNFMYSIHFSSILLIFGRLLCGTAESLKYVMFGEISQCYVGEKLASVYICSGVLSNLGLILAPLLNFVFKYVNVNLGEFYLTNLNFVGVFMGSLFVVVQVLSCFFISNCSKEFNFTDQLYSVDELNHKFVDNGPPDKTIYFYDDLGTENNLLDQKESVKIGRKNHVNGNSVRYHANKKCTVSKITPDCHNEKTRLLAANDKKPNVTKELLLNSNFLFILFFSFLFWFMISCYDNLLPVFVLTTFNWDITELNIILLCTGMVTVILITYMNTKLLTSNGLFKCLLYLLTGMILVSVTLIITSHYTSHTKIEHIAFLVIIGLMFSLISVLPELYFISAINYTTSSDSRSLSSLIRNYSCKLGSLFGFLTSIFLFNFLEEFTITVLSCFAIGIIFMLVKRKYLREKQIAVNWL